MSQQLKHIVDWKYFRPWICDKKEKAKQSDFKLEGTGRALLSRASMTQRLICTLCPKHAHIQQERCAQLFLVNTKVVSEAGGSRQQVQEVSKQEHVSHKLDCYFILFVHAMRLFFAELLLLYNIFRFKISSSTASKQCSIRLTSSDWECH